MTGCWYWKGGISLDGYGRSWSRAEQRETRAHRLVYELLVGPIPDGLQLDHLCRVRTCVNPDHLRVVTCRENVMAPGSRCIQALNAAKTHCPADHMFDELNTYMYHGKRNCRACRKAKDKARGPRSRISAYGAIPIHSAAVPSGTDGAVTAGISAAVASAC